METHFRVSLSLAKQIQPAPFFVKHKRDVCECASGKAKIITGQLQKRSDRNFSRRADSVREYKSGGRAQ